MSRFTKERFLLSPEIAETVSVARFNEDVERHRIEITFKNYKKDLTIGEKVVIPTAKNGFLKGKLIQGEISYIEHLSYTIVAEEGFKITPRRTRIFITNLKIIEE